MNVLDALQLEMGRVLDTLGRRHGSTADPREKKSIGRLIRAMDKQQSRSRKASSLDAAAVLYEVTTDLEKAVAAAKTAPFDGYLSALEGHLDRLFLLSGELHACERLFRAPELSEDRGPPLRGLLPLPDGLPPPRNSTLFTDLESEYAAYFRVCAVRPECASGVEYHLKRLEKSRAMYEEVGRALGDLPWVLVGAIHAMECGFNFAGHLHNGDPLTARTVHVPAGRPSSGSPPYTWRDSAVDALRLQGLDKITDWSPPRMLYCLERYNGFGYRKKGLPTPYLWSFSNLYERGKFTADGKFDTQAVSKQCGAATMLKAVLERA